MTTWFFFSLENTQQIDGHRELQTVMFDVDETSDMSADVAPNAVQHMKGTVVNERA